MTENDEQLAARLADAAGRILLDLRAAGDLAGKALGQAGDEAANAMLCRELRAARPDDALLSEEEKDNSARLASYRVWIVDPLDGTREYGEGRSDWAVHVALAIDGVADACQPHPPCCGGGSGRRTDGRGTACDGLGGSEGHGRGARRGRHLSAHRRPI